jgi:non-specific serine/threonine protein kinase/serine/threonine-protein kinase
MNPERHQLLTDLLDEALKRQAAERAAFLSQACAGDATLRSEVESLIASFEQSPDFIEASALAGIGELFSEEQPMEGRRLGHYQLVRELGRGGMGAVYLAERADEYREKVALKLVKRGMDTEFVVRRFRHERQILASLHHPNIARLLDGGTTEDGLPYFVMEYIEGEPVDEYCDHHNLSIIERLKLFRTICAAVHYAHQNLVIHRDLKPGNILIAADGTVKLLDFGIARILNPEISQTVEKTATMMRLMTPEYASPEQVRGEQVTTASDVYSLGVILYELLTGHRPYRITSILPSDIERVICEQEPIRPSTAITRVEERLTADGTSVRVTPEQVSRTREGQPEKLQRRLRGDLDNIVLMALRKEPQRRYASVEHFSEDIRRHLEGLPVTARKDTPGYRAAKFIRRHKVGVGAAALVLLSLVAGLIGTITQARRAQAAQARAERLLKEARGLTSQLLFEFHDSIEKLPGATPARALLVKRALQVYGELARETGNDEGLKEELATAYLKLGDVQGRPGFPNLGDTAGALASYRQALEIREALPAALKTGAEARRELATNYDRIGDALRLSGDAAGAMASYRQAFTIREALWKADSNHPLTRRDLGMSYERLGDALAQTGKSAEALAHQRQAVALYEAVYAVEPNELETRRKLFIGYIKLGDRLRDTGEKKGALTSYRRAVPVSQTLAADEPLNARAQRELSICHEKIGNALIALKDQAGAIASYRESLKIRERLAEVDKRNAEAQRDLSNAYTKMADVLEGRRDLTGALNYYRAALMIDEQLARLNEANTQARQDCANSYEKIGGLLARRGALVEALTEHLEAMKLRRRIAEQDHENMEVRRELAASYTRLGEINAALARWNDAKLYYQQSLAVLRELEQRGALSRDEAWMPERIARELTRCEVALRR